LSISTDNVSTFRQKSRRNTHVPGPDTEALVKHATVRNLQNKWRHNVNRPVHDQQIVELTHCPNVRPKLDLLLRQKLRNPQ
jgi:methylase of polypeptide subunit release factors